MNCNKNIRTLAAAIGAILVIGGCTGKAVVPTSYNTYNAKDGSFQIQYPAGWEADGGDRSGYAWAEFTSGGAVISIDANVIGSLIGDISKSSIIPMGIVTDQEDRHPVAAVHAHEKQGFEDKKGVTEEKPVPVKTGFPDAEIGIFRRKDLRRRDPGLPCYGPEQHQANPRRLRVPGIRMGSLKTGL